MPAWICVTCGNQLADSDRPPETCAICVDPRQYVGWEGQRWTTLDRLAQDHHTVVKEVETGLWGVGVEPSFAIGQRGLLVHTAAGNLLWDVPGFLDEGGADRVVALGGVEFLSASHPHFYGVMVEWAHEFDATILLPEADRDWVMRPDAAIEFYRDRLDPLPGVNLVRCGGHFPGSAVAHWSDGAEGAGALLTGDTLSVVPDRDHVSVMWSYPNLIPVDAATIRSVAGRIARLDFDRVYGGWWGRVVSTGAKGKVLASLDRYARIVNEGPPD